MIYTPHQDAVQRLVCTKQAQFRPHSLYVFFLLFCWSRHDYEYSPKQLKSATKLEDINYILIKRITDIWNENLNTPTIWRFYGEAGSLLWNARICEVNVTFALLRLAPNKKVALLQNSLDRRSASHSFILNRAAWRVECCNHSITVIIIFVMKWLLFELFSSFIFSILISLSPVPVSICRRRMIGAVRSNRVFEVSRCE